MQRRLLKELVSPRFSRDKPKLKTIRLDGWSWRVVIIFSTMEKLVNDFSFGLFFWQILLFVLLLFLLRKFAWKPILNSVNDREEGIQKALAAAEEAKKEMQNVTADSEKLLKEARAEREAMLKEAREIKDKMIADSKEQAKVEGDKMINRHSLPSKARRKRPLQTSKIKLPNFPLRLRRKC